MKNLINKLIPKIAYLGSQIIKTQKYSDFGFWKEKLSNNPKNWTKNVFEDGESKNPN